MQNLKIENENIEIKLLLEAMYLKYGYDFRNYSKASIKRRILYRLSRSGLKTISEMQHKILYDKQFFEILIQDFSINVTEMFRDPSFYKSIREKVIPVLKKLPFIKIWHAGCATGEEVYSMAILLKEEGLYDNITIYATDFNEGIIKKAKDGIYPAERLKEYTYNYQKAGGKSSFADYYSAKYDYALINKSLEKNIVFAEHNLVTDWVFGEMNMIMCRNVLIYFNRDLQNRVIHLFRNSLCKDGFLCLGSKESIRFSECSDDFVDFVKKEKIYRKK
ncbi:MAG: protein-glutamate O-methyltransferase CheR [Proteobacteria bacterium]|nr:protein-glutamate O-methyltransferase CheR [Pseudomonadota bacterium]